MNNRERRKIIRQLRAKLVRVRDRVLAMHEEEDDKEYTGAVLLLDASNAIGKAILYLDARVRG